MKPLIGICSDILRSEGERDRAFAYLTYVESVIRAGGMPVIVPPQPESAAELIAQLDGVLLAGGADCDPGAYGEVCHPSVHPMDPRRQANDLAFARLARERKIPALGICLGLQIMNVACGGTLVQDIDSSMKTPIRHAPGGGERDRHDVSITEDSKLYAILAERSINVNSSHHQSVKEPATGLGVTAVAPDSVIEGLEDSEADFYLGVQWHPEEMVTEESAARLFAAFVLAARRYAESRRR